MLRRLRALDRAVLDPGPLHDRMTIAGSWVAAALLTLMVPPLVFLGGIGAFWVGVGSRVAVACVVAFLPVVISATAYFISRRRRSKRVAWTVAMAVALPAMLVPWFVVVAASAM